MLVQEHRNGVLRALVPGTAAGAAQAGGSAAGGGGGSGGGGDSVSGARKALDVAPAFRCESSHACLRHGTGLAGSRPLHPCSDLVRSVCEAHFGRHVFDFDEGASAVMATLRDTYMVALLGGQRPLVMQVRRRLPAGG